MSVAIFLADQSNVTVFYINPVQDWKPVYLPQKQPLVPLSSLHADAAPNIMDSPACAAGETLSLFYHNLLANQLQMWHVMTIMRLDVT